MSESESILEGKGKTDYEKYLKIEDLLGCQKASDELVHHDELLFQIVHQTAELWMKQELHELSRARSLIERGVCLHAVSTLDRVNQIQKILTDQLHVVETLSPWDYHTIRRVLGKGSGMESPGFQALVLFGPTLWPPYARLLADKGLAIDDVFLSKDEHYPLYLLAEALADFDEYFQLWRFHHLKLVEREIGGKVKSLKGRAIDFLTENMDVRFFSELWDVRNRLTERAGTSY